MARIGLKYLRYSKLDANDEVTQPENFGRAVNCNVSIESNSAVLYADDAVAESDTSFNKGTVALSVDDDDDKVFADILGHNISDDGEVVRNSTDNAPYVAIGRILTKVVRGVRKYKVEFLSKVKFAETLPEETTKGESIQYVTPSLNGTVMQKENGDWSKTKTFTNFEEASKYLDDLLTDPKKKINIEVPTGDTDTNLGGKKVNELQDNVKIGILNNLNGTINYVQNFDGFEKGAKGNFLALYFPECKSGATVTCELKGDGSKLKKPVEVDPKDGLIVFQIANKNQTIEVVSVGKDTRVLTLTELELKTE